MKNIPEGFEPCWKCQGSGVYYFGGAVVNGVYQGKSDVCFPCKGKGYQTKADKKRTEYYYRFHFHPQI